MLNRRGLLLGLIAAPAIVKASSLMPVKPWLDSRVILTSDLIVNPAGEGPWLIVDNHEIIPWWAPPWDVPQRWRARHREMVREYEAQGGGYKLMVLGPDRQFTEAA